MQAEKGPLAKVKSADGQISSIPTKKVLQAALVALHSKIEAGLARAE
jgi:hypothetical protein